MGCLHTHVAELPPRASILMSLCLVQRGFLEREVVYQLHDHPFNIFMVGSANGVFAYVAKSTPTGGIDEVPISIRPTNFAGNTALSAVKFIRASVDKEEHKHKESPQGRRHSLTGDLLH